MADSLPQYTVSLEWDPVPDPGIDHYRIYVGSSSHEYSTTYDSGETPSFEVPGLELGATYYFAVSAIGVDGVESPLSEELAVDIAVPPLPTGTQLVANDSGKIALSWTFPKAELGSGPEFIVESSTDLVNWVQVATVSSEQWTTEDDSSVGYSWPIDTSETRRFYRLASKNFIGSSSR